MPYLRGLTAIAAAVCLALAVTACGVLPGEAPMGLAEQEGGLEPLAEEGEGQEPASTDEGQGPAGTGDHDPLEGILDLEDGGLDYQVVDGKYVWTFAFGDTLTTEHNPYDWIHDGEFDVEAMLEDVLNYDMELHPSTSFAIDYRYGDEITFQYGFIDRWDPQDHYGSVEYEEGDSPWFKLLAGTEAGDVLIGAKNVYGREDSMSLYKSYDIVDSVNDRTAKIPFDMCVLLLYMAEHHTGMEDYQAMADINALQDGYYAVAQ